MLTTSSKIPFRYYAVIAAWVTGPLLWLDETAGWQFIDTIISFISSTLRPRDSRRVGLVRTKDDDFTGKQSFHLGWQFIDAIFSCISSTLRPRDSRRVGLVRTNDDVFIGKQSFHLDSSVDFCSTLHFVGRRGGSMWDFVLDRLESLSHRPGSRWFFLGRRGGSFKHKDDSLIHRPGALGFGLLFHLSSCIFLSSWLINWCCTFMIKSISSWSETLKLILFCCGIMFW